MHWNFNAKWERQNPKCTSQKSRSLKGDFKNATENIQNLCAFAPLRLCVKNILNNYRINSAR
jgi:hypothetical protein